MKLAGGITLMGPWPNGEASCFETPRLPGAAAQVPWGRGASAPPRQAWDPGMADGGCLPPEPAKSGRLRPPLVPVLRRDLRAPTLGVTTLHDWPGPAP